MSAHFSLTYLSYRHLCLLLLLALFRFCLSKKTSDNVLCMDVESRALLQFKDQLVDEADRLASWDGDPESDCCKWAGIVCDNFTGHVHRVHLRALEGRCRLYDYNSEKEQVEALKQRLKGVLSPSLLDLKQLEHLDLSCNDFGGIQIPSFLGSLGNLNYLNLSNSEFSGTVPPQLGNLSEMHVLCLGTAHNNFDIESTSMTNTQWLSNLRLLRHLETSGVDLSRAIDWLQVINTLPSLVQLHMSNCQLLHIHPHVPSLNITSLSLLDLSYNDFNTSMPQWIFSITSLVSLDLSGCNFHGPIPSSIYSFRNLTSLKFLHVSGNDFMNTSSVLRELSSVGSTLISLNISSCNVSSSVLNVLHNLTSLLNLDLTGNQLTETIPKSLGNLCNMRDVDLSSNIFGNITLTYLLESFFECKSPSLESISVISSGLSGCLPDQLGHLIHLEHMQLYDNHINGSIPDSIGQLSFLRLLDLGMNLLSGPIPFSIGRLSSLEMLHLSHNQLNGSLPNSLGQLSKLGHLSFSNNFLVGVVTELHFAKLVSLIYLNGSGNNLTLRPLLANWIPPFRLQYLYLSSWGLGPQFPLWLQLQSDLLFLDISNTRISSPIPESFWRSFPNLNYLDMSRNRIQGTLMDIPATIHMLYLSSNEFRGKLPGLSNDSYPLLLDLSNNYFAGSLHHLLCSNGVRWTTVLNLGNNHLSGDIPECWEKWPYLLYLNLENNNLSGGIPRTLGLSSDLISLDMNGNKLMGRLPASLMNLTNLVVLQLGRNELVGSIPSWLGRELSSLRILNLRSNYFDGQIPLELCNPTHIQILDLAHNNLSGNIPRCINKFSVLSGEKITSKDQFVFFGGYSVSTICSDSLLIKGREDMYSTILPLVMLLDLSSNNFTGHIPSELTALLKLKSLNLSRNQLTGSIPEKIGDIKALESFDVSLNRLSGELPMSLSSLNFLSSVNVSYNNLTGSVPSSTQLQSFNESSFFGNKLCGDPLTDRCVVKVPDTKDQKEDDGSHGTDLGLIISIVLGFISGFWIVFAPLIASRSWRIAYFRFMNELGYMVYDFMHKYCFNMFSS